MQELLVKQLKQSGQGLQQLQQSKFLLLNAQQATSGSSSISSSSSSISSSIKLQQKGEVQTGFPSKQEGENVAKVTVMQAAQAGVVQPSSTSKQATKKVLQIPTKQAVATTKQPSSQQKNEGHKQQLHEKSQPQETCIKDTAKAKRVEINQQQTKKDDDSHPQSKRKKQRPPKNAMSQDSVHVDKGDAESDQKKVETPPVVRSPVQREVDAAEALTRAVKKEVDIMLCFVCLEERYVNLSLVHCMNTSKSI